jgi:hypothetical protein
MTTVERVRVGRARAVAVCCEDGCGWRFPDEDSAPLTLGYVRAAAKLHSEVCSHTTQVLATRVLEYRPVAVSS